jgi:hypothetical protein
VYTSIEALQQSVPESAGSFRVVALADLVDTVDPAHVIAVDPGRPTAAHLPAGRLRALVEAAMPPANEAEAAMVTARRIGALDALLAALVRAEMHVPMRAASPSRDLTDPGFAWLAIPGDGGTDVTVPVFTSPDRLHGYLGGDVDFVVVNALHLAEVWPDRNWTLAVNPTTPMAVTLTGEMVADLAGFLRTAVIDTLHATALPEDWWSESAPAEVLLQVVVPPAAVADYLRDGYDRIAGAVHLRPPGHFVVTPAALYLRLGLLGAGSSFALTDPFVHIVRWRPAPEQAGEWLRDGTPRTAAVALPDGAELHRIHADGEERAVAVFDRMRRRWSPAE